MEALKLKDIQFGKTAAESEQALDNGKFLLFVHHDLVDLKRIIQEKKYIVLGRKGAGKSYLKEYAHLNKSYDLFSDFISFKDLDYEKFSKANTSFQLNNALLWEFIFLCKFLKLAFEDQNIDQRASIVANKLWSHIPSYLEPKTYETTKVIEEHSGEIKTALFSNLFQATTGNKIKFEKEKATYAQMNQYLKSFLINYLKNSRSEINYVLFIDEIDENYKGSNEDRDAVADIVKVARGLFGDFQREGINFFPIVLLRNDIFQQLGKKLDVRKLMDDSLVRIRWYDESAARQGLENTNLRSFLEKRLEYSYRKKFEDKYEDTDLWDLQFTSAEMSGDVMFKYIADRTLYRPRDFISLLLKIQNKYKEAKIVTKEMVDNSLSEYATSLIEEFKFELRIHFSDEIVESVMNNLCSLPPTPFSKEALELDTIKLDEGKTSDDIFSNLFNYGIIGIQKGTQYYWKHRNNEVDFNDFNENDTKLLKHNALNYYKRSKFQQNW